MQERNGKKAVTIQEIILSLQPPRPSVEFGDWPVCKEEQLEDPEEDDAVFLQVLGGGGGGEGGEL